MQIGSNNSNGITWNLTGGTVVIRNDANAFNNYIVTGVTSLTFTTNITGNVGIVPNTRIATPATGSAFEMGSDTNMQIRSCLIFAGSLYLGWSLTTFML